MQQATARIMHDSSRGGGGTRRRGKREGGGGETSVCMAVRQPSCQRTHHISTAQPARFPLQLFPPAFIYRSPSPPFCLSFMRTKANKQQNICMLSQHMRRQRQSQSQSQRCQARHCSCACASPAPPTAAEVFCIAKQKL